MTQPSSTKRAGTWGAVVTALVLAATCGCAASGAAVATAAVNTALAGGVSAYERSQGRCYAACPTGTACEPRTGLCEPLPCRGQCAMNQKCDQTGLVEHCVPAADVDLKIETSGTTVKAPPPAPPPPPAPVTPL